MIEIVSHEARFTDSAVDIAFGGVDAQVVKTWVVSPSVLRLNVAVRTGTPAGTSILTVFSGLRTLTSLLEIEPQNGRPTLTSDLSDQESGSGWVYPGRIALLGAAQTGEAGDLILTLDGHEARIVSVSPNAIAFEVPELPAGPAVARLWRAGGEIAAPVFVTIGPKPPEIKGVVESTVRPGGSLTLYVARLGDASGRIEVRIGDVLHSAFGEISPAPDREGEHRVMVYVSPFAVPGQLVPVTISVDGRTSAPYPITVTP
jgi:hypothetical protein